MNNTFPTDDNSKVKMQPTANMDRHFFRASAADFKKIPGSPIAYWVSEKVRFSFQNFRPLAEIAKPRQGLATSDNDRFLKQWFEPSIISIGFGCKSKQEALYSKKRWFPCQKGGPFKKWYGNNNYVVNWENDGEELLAFATKLYKSPTRTIKNIPFYFKEGVTWSTISSSALSMRFSPWGFISETKGAICFSDDRDILIWILGFSNSKLVNYFLRATSPTLDYHEGPVGKLPLNTNIDKLVLTAVERNIELAAIDWNIYEISWGFTDLPLLQSCYRQPTLKATYQKLRIHWAEMTLEMQRLEEENNRIFIEAYGLQDELTPDVPLHEITLTGNPYYRYGKKVESGEQEMESDGKKTFPFDPELEERLLSDTMKEFLSYAVGCMFGRYSLDAPGLILANQGDGLEDYIRIIEEKVASGQGLVASENQNLATSHQLLTTAFEPDADNVIPILGDNWFTDDIVERFQRFLRVTFGDEHYEENLKFIEKAIGKSIRKYFLKDFYKDHVKTYKKRPIYWLFSSPKGNFNALIYMHRYRPDTVSVILNDYLREFRTKLVARKEHLEKVSISANADNREKTTALKESEKLAKIIDELNAYETTIYDLATKNIEIDLDDGVKTNYPKFGNALKKIPGLS